MPKGLSTIFGVILSLVLSTLPNQILLAGAPDQPFLSTQQQSLPMKGGPQLLSQQSYASPGEAASSALEILKSPEFFRDETGGVERARNLGFESVAEVANATLGKPIKVINVNLGQLQDNVDPKTLVVDPHTQIYPVYVKSSVRSSLTVSDPSMTNTWLRMGRGSPVLIRKIEKVRQQQEQPEDVFFLVANRGIGLRFLARMSGNKITITPLDTFSFGTLVLKPGEERPAEDVIRDLAPVAKKLFEILQRRNISAGQFSQASDTH